METVGPNTSLAPPEMPVPNSPLEVEPRSAHQGPVPQDPPVALYPPGSVDRE